MAGVRGGHVSNPHRYGQKHGSGGAAETGGEVSNPHRYGQKPQYVREAMSYIRGVSNPHRYGQRAARHRHHGPHGNGFKPS